MIPGKISCCLLVRDDAATLRECLESIRPHVDQLVVLDTGSSDDSPAIARHYADKLEFFLGCNDSENRIEDFAAARNHALKFAECEFHAWFDADDVIVGGEHLRALAASRPAETVMWLIPYEYQHDAAGRVTIMHHRENLVVPTSSFQWQTPVHEVLVAKPGKPPPVPIPAPQVRRVHRKQFSKRPDDPQRNLRIMEKYVQKSGEGDIRALYYYGVELMQHRPPGEALMVLRRYFQLSQWGDEQILAALQIARCYQALHDYEAAIEWALKAMVTKSWPEPYWTLAECYFDLALLGKNPDHNFRRCAHFADLGMSLPEADTVLFTNPTKRAEIHRILSVALYKAGHLERALSSAQKGLAGLPEDTVLQQNARSFEVQTIYGDLVAKLNRLHSLGAVTIELGQQVVNMLSGAPPPTPALPVPSSAPPPAQQAAEGCLDVAFFVGPGFEPWNPETMAKTGMGGSETMAWELAKRLRGFGHRVRLFGHCSAEAPEGVFDGVEYLDTTRYPGTSCDVLIASRHANAVDEALNVRAKARLLWVHDVVPYELDQRRALRFDRILALSEWHRSVLRQVYPTVDPEKFAVTRNGIDALRFANVNYMSGAVTADGERIEVPRAPTKVVYSSSPDRGLPCLLELWPEVLRAVPDAELHVFYGAANLEKIIAATGDPELSAMHRRTLHMAKSMPSVKMRGRVGQAELAREFLSAGVWVLPGGFTETSCISAAEAQAAGCHVVCSANAALNETVGARGTLVGGFVQQETRMPPEQSEAYKLMFAKGIIDAIGAARSGPNVEGMAWARECWTLDGLASDWDIMLRELVAELTDRVVPRFWSAA